MPVYEVQGMRPEIAESAWVSPDAVVIGQVKIGERVSIWPGVVLRGDISSITVGEGSNIQDNSVVHVTKDLPTVIGCHVTVGHSVTLHSCFLEDNTVIGMSSTVLDLARVKKGSMLAAGALLSPNKVIPEGELWGGIPASLKRKLTEQDQKDFMVLASHYVSHIGPYKQTLKRIG